MNRNRISQHAQNLLHTHFKPDSTSQAHLPKDSRKPVDVHRNPTNLHRESQNNNLYPVQRQSNRLLRGNGLYCSPDFNDLKYFPRANVAEKNVSRYGKMRNTSVTNQSQQQCEEINCILNAQLAWNDYNEDLRDKTRVNGGKMTKQMGSRGRLEKDKNVGDATQVPNGQNVMRTAVRAKIQNFKDNNKKFFTEKQSQINFRDKPTIAEEDTQHQHCEDVTPSRSHRINAISITPNSHSEAFKVFKVKQHRSPQSNLQRAKVENNVGYSCQSTVKKAMKNQQADDGFGSRNNRLPTKYSSDMEGYGVKIIDESFEIDGSDCDNINLTEILTLHQSHKLLNTNNITQNNNNKQIPLQNQYTYHQTYLQRNTSCNEQLDIIEEIQAEAYDNTTNNQSEIYSFASESKNNQVTQTSKTTQQNSASNIPQNRSSIQLDESQIVPVSTQLQQQLQSMITNKERHHKKPMNAHKTKYEILSQESSLQTFCRQLQEYEIRKYLSKAQKISVIRKCLYLCIEQLERQSQIVDMPKRPISSPFLSLHEQYGKLWKIAEISFWLTDIIKQRSLTHETTSSLPPNFYKDFQHFLSKAGHNYHHCQIINFIKDITTHLTRHTDQMLIKTLTSTKKNSSAIKYARQLLSHPVFV